MASMNIMDELIEDVELRFHNCGTSTHQKGWSEKKKHPDYDLWIVTSGEVTLDYRGEKSIALEGDMVFFNPEVTYTASCSNEPCSHIFIHFDFPVGKRFNFLNEFDLMGVIPQRYFAKEGELFRHTFDSYVNRDPMAPLMLKGYFLVLLAKLLTIPQGNPSEPHASHEQTKHFARLKPVLQYIEEHIGENISTELLAEMIGLSPKYFYVFFKNNIGLTPHHYMTRIRMNRARDMLFDRKLTVKEIAYQLGFADPYTFSKIFKRFHKTSPSRFYDHT
jgi:AraC family transcriptional regulator